MAKRRRRARMRRALYTTPKWMYQSRLGSLLGKRFIAIEHEGRNTGATYLTPVEVIYHDKDSNEYYVISARGERSDWYRNISKYPASYVYFGSRRRRVDQRMVPVDEAVAAMKVYERDHPKAATSLLELAGVKGDSSAPSDRDVSLREAIRCCELGYSILSKFATRPARNCWPRAPSMSRWS